jgi:hypothetical protein
MSTKSGSSITCFPLYTYEQQQAAKQICHEITQYKKSRKHYLMTSRFSTQTADENKRFRNKCKIGCTYGSSTPVSSAVPVNAIMFVLEMDITSNQIIGIGMVRNSPCTTLPYSIYEHGNYNRYIFSGKHRIDRSEFGKEELAWIELLENTCFRGTRNLKRGSGLTSFPVEICYIYDKYESLNFVDKICGLFARKLSI